MAWFAALVAAVVDGCVEEWTPGLVIVILLVAGLHPAVLAIEFGLSRRVARDDGQPVAPWLTAVRAWAREWRLGTRVFGWRMPWRTRREPDHVPPSAAGRRGVVLVHGFVCNRAVWDPMIARLRGLDRPVVAVDLEPVLGAVEGYAPAIDAAVTRLEAATGIPPVVLAHSLGGLAVRAWLAGGAARTDRVHSVVTVGTPHRGTWLARFALTATTRRLRLGNGWTTALVGAAPHAALFTCWWSECDQVVFPPPAAQMPGAESRQLPGVPHLALCEAPEIWTDLLARLDER